MIMLVIPNRISGADRRMALARAMRDAHELRLLCKHEARLGRLLKYHQARRSERAAAERVRAWQAVQLPERVA